MQIYNNIHISTIISTILLHVIFPYLANFVLIHNFFSQNHLSDFMHSHHKILFYWHLQIIKKIIEIININ